MGSAAALAAACARGRLRARGAAALLVLGPAALLWAVLSGGSGGPLGAGPAVESALVCVLLLASAVATASGADLPAARATGHGEWFATLSPAAAARRAAPALAGIALTVAGGAAAAALAALLLAASGRDVDTHATSPVTFPAGALLGKDGPAEALVLPAGAGGGVLEMDLRPRFRDPEAATIATVPILVSFDGARTVRVDAPVRGTLFVPLPAGEAPRRVGLALEDDSRLRLLVAGARVRGAPQSFAVNVFFAGLLLALAAASVVPAAVLCSRATSAPTAIATGATLLLLGLARGDLLAWAADLRATDAGALAGGVLRGAVALAPDLSAASAAGEAALGRGIGAAAFGGLLPAAAHAGVALLLLAFLPGRPRGAP